jgi:uncharacterized Rmd1/YagE family protein
MRCTAHTTANTYALETIHGTFPTDLPSRKSGDALYIELTPDSHVFFFSYGCFICWNTTDTQETQILEKLKTAEHNAYTRISESFIYQVGPVISVIHDTITLSASGDLVMQMLTVSYALSQSIKLTIFEDRVFSRIQSMKHLPEELSQTGRISLSRREISKQIGALFMERNSINLHSDILDAPSFFWDHPEYDDLYLKATKDQDIQTRTAVLNTRLDILKELLDVLHNALENRHSTMLEWIIIVLIFIEVILSLWMHVFKVW